MRKNFEGPFVTPGSVSENLLFAVSSPKGYLLHTSSVTKHTIKRNRKKGGNPGGDEANSKHFAQYLPSKKILTCSLYKCRAGIGIAI